MFAFKMAFSTGVIALLSVFATGGLAQSWSDAQSTETLQPSALGTATSDGALLVSMNYCTVVMSTQCQVSIMTSASSATPLETTAPAIDTTSFPVPTSAPASSIQPTDTPSSSYATEITNPIPSATLSSSTGAPAVTTTALTAAATGMRTFPGAARGAAILALAALW